MSTFDKTIKSIEENKKDREEKAIDLKNEGISICEYIEKMNSDSEEMRKALERFYASYGAFLKAEKGTDAGARNYTFNEVHLALSRIKDSAINLKKKSDVVHEALQSFI